jgi:hypothetical protein
MEAEARSFKRPAISAATMGGRVTAVVAIVSVVGALALAAWRVPVTVAHLGDEAGSHSRLSFADRDIAGGNGVIVDQSAVYAARAIIPANASYRMVVGPNVKNPTSLTEVFSPLYYQYFLLPRRQDDHGRWIVCFGCDLNRVAAGADVVWSGQDGISIGRLP